MQNFKLIQYRDSERIARELAKIKARNERKNKAESYSAIMRSYARGEIPLLGRYVNDPAPVRAFVSRGIVFLPKFCIGGGQREFWIKYPAFDEGLPPRAWAKCRGTVSGPTISVTYGQIVYDRGLLKKPLKLDPAHPLTFDRETGKLFRALPFVRDWELADSTPTPDVFVASDTETNTKRWLADLICHDQSNFKPAKLVLPR